MVNRSGIAVTAIVAIATSAIQPAAAQGYYGPPPGYTAPPPDYYSAPHPLAMVLPSPGYDAPPPSYNYRAPPSTYAAPPPGYAPAPPPNYAAYRCEQQRAGNTAGGAILGAIAGGLFGNAVSRGHGAGTAVGAIAGGLLGASIGNSLSCNTQHYASNVYVTGFEAGRPHHRATPGAKKLHTTILTDIWRSEWITGVRKDAVARLTRNEFSLIACQAATGRACRRPDGTWDMVG